MRVQRVAHPGPSQSGRLVAVFRLANAGSGAEVREWSLDAGDQHHRFEFSQEAAAYVSARIHAINRHDSARSYYARQLERQGWHAT